MNNLPLHKSILILLIGLLCFACKDISEYDVLIKGGKIVDGSGETSFIGDIAINQDTIAAIGKLDKFRGKIEIDASDLIVAPGFINMLSWAVESLIEDGNSQSDIRQGVTLEVFGEGMSMGPLNETSKKSLRESQGDIKYEIEWETLGEYLVFLEKKGISPNVASFVGATTLRINTVGFEDRKATDEEILEMQAMTREAMEEGALGVGSSLIYAPAFYSDTEELIAICKAASEYGGMYISHLRSEGDRLLESIDELITISRAANVPAEIYHLKMSGESNWNKYD